MFLEKKNGQVIDKNYVQPPLVVNPDAGIDVVSTPSVWENGISFPKEHEQGALVMRPNRLNFGDCLEVMQEFLPDDSVDLVYLDPPFNSKRLYNAFIGGSQFVAFDDTWRWHEAIDDFHAVAQDVELSPMMEGLRTMLGEGPNLAYLSYMTHRLRECRRVLKPTGSIYLHCDPTMSHYLKTVMDGVFGVRNFRNEIVWRRSNAHNKLSKKYGPIHDIILFYSVSDKFTFHPGRTPYSKKYINDRFTESDERGTYQTNYLTGPNIRHAESGKEWRGFNPTDRGRHWAIPRSLRPFLPDQGKGMSSLECLEELYKQDLIVLPDKIGGQPMYKQYIGDGVLYQDLWMYQPNTSGVLYGTDDCIDQDVKWLENEKEKLGFETQKPQGLLRRILTASSEPDDIILDPFCGCGTTIHTAQGMGRQWVGIDVCTQACKIIQDRLERHFDVLWSDIEFVGMPMTVDDAKVLAASNKFKFERWAASLTPGMEANKKQVADKGVDGKGRYPIKKGVFVDVVSQVKGGGTGPGDVQAFNGARLQANADMGVFTCFENRVTHAMRDAAVNTGRFQKWPVIQIYTVEDYFAGRKPDLPLAA